MGKHLLGYAGLLLGLPIIGFLAEWQNKQIALSFTLFLILVKTLLSFRSGSVKSVIFWLL